MVIRVNVPGQGVVGFPDGTSPEIIEQALSQSFGAPQPQPQAPMRSVVDSPAPDLSTLSPVSTPDMQEPPNPMAALSAQVRGQNPFEPQKFEEYKQRVAEGAKNLPRDREAMRALGSTVGSVGGALVGAPAGPGAAATFVGGGMLGAAAGDVLYNILNAPETPISSPVEAIAEEGMFQAAGPVLSKTIRPLKSAISKVAGVGKEGAQRLIQKAEGLGIDLGAINVSDNDTLRSITKVLGVLPYVGTPIRKASEKQFKQLEAASQNILNEVAPNATLFEVGVDLSNAASSKFNKFSRIAAAKYNKFFNMVEEAGNPAIINTGSVKEALGNIGAKRQASSIPGVAAETSEMTQFVDDLAQLPERITATQARGLQKRINTLLTEAASTGSKKGMGDLLEVKSSLEAAFHNPDIDFLKGLNVVPQETADDIGRTLADANKFYAENIKRFETPSAKRFGRIDKNIFKPGFQKPGTRPEDQAFSAVFDTKSPQALQDLRDVVGKMSFKKAARKHLDDAFTQSFIEDAATGAKTFNSNRFIKKLNLDTPEGLQVLEETLKDTGVRPQTLRDFAEVAQKIGEVPIPLSSSFLQRRLLLGGVGALGVTGGAFGIGAIPMMSILFLGRKTFDAMANPAALKSMTKLLDDSIPTRAKRRAYVELTRKLFSKEEADQLIEEAEGLPDQEFMFNYNQGDTNE